MQFVTAANSSTAEGLLIRPSPDARAYMKTLGHVSLTPLTQYLAAEQNRALYETWGTVQIALSGAFFFLLLFGTRMGKVPLAMALLLFLITLGDRLFVVPQMEMIGRATDFAADPSHRVRLARDVLGYGTSVMEVAKWVLALGVGGFLIFERSGQHQRARRISLSRSIN
jgi:hypothetical protein